MTAEKALQIAEQMRADFAPRESAIELCRRYGYQMRKNGSPTWQDDKTDTLSPVPSSIPASLAMRLAMYLHANTLGVGNLFFALTAESRDPKKVIPDVDKNKVRNQTQKVMHRLFDTNFSSETNIAFNDLAVIGNNATRCEFNEATNSFEFKSFSVGDGVYLAENSKGQRDMFCRYFKYDAKQAKQEFGEAAGARVDAVLSGQGGESDSFEYMWLVYPRGVFKEETGDGRGKKVPDKKKAFGSVIVDVEERRIVRERGYDDFPFAAPTWMRRGGSIYGYSPIEVSISDITDLFEMIYLKKTAAKKQVHPPLVVSSLWEGINTDANEVSFVEGDVANQFAALPSPTQVPVLDSEIEQRINNIRMNMMLDTFETLGDHKNNMTTAEINGRIGQSVRAIAPIVARLHKEYFSPLIKRVFNIMVDRGEIELPSTVSRDMVSIKYVSVLDTLILQGESTKMLEFIGSVMNLIQARGGLGEEFDCYLNMERILAHLSEYFNVPTDVIRESKVVADMLDELKKQRIALQEAQIKAQAIKPIDMQKRAQPGAPLALPM